MATTTTPSGLYRDEEILAYAAIGGLVLAIAFTVLAIFV